MVISRLSINEAGPDSDFPHLGQVTETLPSNPIGIFRISMTPILFQIVLWKKAESDSDTNGSLNLQISRLNPTISLLDDVNFIQTLFKKPQSIAGGGSFPVYSASNQDVQRIHNKHQLALDYLELLTENKQHKCLGYTIYFHISIFRTMIKNIETRPERLSCCLLFL